MNPVPRPSLARALAPAALAALAWGCQYELPGLDGPPEADAARVPPVETDVDIEGYVFTLVTFDEEDAANGRYECYVTESFEGRRRDDIASNSCRGCDRYYRVKLYLLTDAESDPCGLADVFPFMSSEGRTSNIGLTPIADADGSFSWLGNYGITDLLYTDWTPGGENAGSDYGFLMYGIPDGEALEGEHYLAGEWGYFGYYYYRLNTDAVDEGTVYSTPQALVGTYN
ncbi:hypothetical protein L6R50_14235 [Myxococcota bacterium]|nr:hypothetical protein [Myxococcota bacterium]